MKQMDNVLSYSQQQTTATTKNDKDYIKKKGVNAAESAFTLLKTAKRTRSEDRKPSW